MSRISSTDFLRYVLWADAVSCLACGILQVTFTAWLSEQLGLPAPLLADTGVFLLLFGAAVAFLAARIPAPGSTLWLLIAGNIAWGVGCIALLLAGILAPTLLGKAYIIAQTLTVAVLAQLQYAGLRHSSANTGKLSRS